MLDGLEPNLPLDPSTALPIVFGPQGGFHVFLSVDTQGLNPGSDNLSDGYANDDLTRVLWQVIAPDGLLSTDYEQRVVAERVGDSWRLGPHLVLLQYYETPPDMYDTKAREAEINASDIEISVWVEDADGVAATDSETIHLMFSAE